MDKRILFQPPGAAVHVLIPLECELTLEQIGEKDVPEGLPFWIVETNTVPADRAFRAAWELDPNSMGPASGRGGQK